MKLNNILSIGSFITAMCVLANVFMFTGALNQKVQDQKEQMEKVEQKIDTIVNLLLERNLT